LLLLLLLSSASGVVVEAETSLDWEDLTGTLWTNADTKQEEEEPTVDRRKVVDKNAPATTMA